MIEGIQRRRPGTESFVLVHGGTKGAAALAAGVARRLEWAQVRAYPAERGAREQADTLMVETEHTEAEPIDLAVGFIDYPLTANRNVHRLFKRLRTAEVAIWMIWAPFYRGIDTFQEPPWDRGNHRAPAVNRSVQVPPRR